MRYIQQKTIDSLAERSSQI